MAGPNIDRIGIPILIVGGLIWWGVSSFVPPETFNSGHAKSGYDAPMGVYPVSVEAPPVALPAQQQAFINIIDQARRQYAQASNDMAKGAARPARAENICALLASPQISNWIGKVKTLSSNGDGKGVLSIEISKDLEIKTWNNAASDTFDRTLIDPKSQLFQSASVLREGQKVQFSGSFIKDRGDCFRESSMSLAGSIRDPEFVFRFTSIAPQQ